MEPIRLRWAQTLYATPRLALAVESYTTPDGIIERTVLHHPGAVAIIAQPDPGHILLVRQYRYALRREILEIPAGTLDPGEEPRTAAHRELIEETGYRAESLSEVLRFHPAVGLSDELMVLYQALGLTAVGARPDPGEIIEGELVALRDIPTLIACGDICDAKTLIALGTIGLSMLPLGSPAPVPHRGPPC